MEEITLADSLDEAMAETRGAVEELLDTLLEPLETPEASLLEAMRYGVLGGGKRLRPFLVVASSSLFHVDHRSALRVAAAVECVHCYSLMHDDLPAMDDSTLRRGQATVHRAFDEATAILAGDALLTLAFQILSDPATHGDPAVRSDLVLGLSKAAGPHGMVGGQMLDLIAENSTFELGEITRLQRLKTGEMIAYGATAGAVLGKVPHRLYTALHSYAHDLGLAFQITDDLLDQEGESARTGKATGQDAAAGKETFVSILGPERAREQARLLVQQAKDHLGPFDGDDETGRRAGLLKAVADYVIERQG